MSLKLALIGFGNVGQEFARLLLSKREWLRGAVGLDVEVLTIATRTRGSLTARNALDLDRVLRERESLGTVEGYGPESTDLSTLEIIESCDADIMVELTPLDIDAGQPAIDYIKAAFDAGLNVITANKGPLAFAYRELKSMAQSRGLHFKFEGVVMDGTPVFRLVEKTLPGCEITGVAGILNSTSNFVLSEIALGRSMEEALDEAKGRGITEADPSMDIDGWDAAVKITALANVLMDARSTPKEADVTGIRDIDLENVMKAALEGKKLKPLARAERVGGEVRTRVRPELVGPENPFWSVDGASSAITLETDLMGEITLIERNPTLAQTAYAIFSDMLIVAQSICEIKI